MRMMFRYPAVEIISVCGVSALAELQRDAIQGNHASIDACLARLRRLVFGGEGGKSRKSLSS